MSFFYRHRRLIIEIIFFLFVFCTSIDPVRNMDTWFHLKMGEVMAHQGILHRDPFSYTTQGEMYPFEWLFQVFLYYVKTLIGLSNLTYFLPVLVCVFIFSMYSLIRTLFDKLSPWLCLIATFLFYVSVFDFLVLRPYILAYTFLILNILLILLYTEKKRNLLWITLPISYMWANMHGSIFLDVFLFLMYAGVTYVRFLLNKIDIYKRQTQLLTLYAIITFIISILPPIGFVEYKLLFIFLKEHAFISRFVTEWQPIINDQYGLLAYPSAFFLTFVLFFVVTKKKKFAEIVWLIPFVFLIVLGVTAVRNMILGYIGLTIFMSWNFYKLQEMKKNRWLLVGFYLLIIALLISHTIILYLKRIPERLYYPVNAAQFIKNFHLQGHMFNEYDYGGYLLYQLYPQQKVFIDGRIDAYLCCTVKEYDKLITEQDASNDVYERLLNYIWNKYDISFAVLRSDPKHVAARTVWLLYNDPRWQLVFWDNDAYVFVRKDGKNNEILKKFNFKYATPLLNSPAVPGHEKEAYQEYLRMISLGDSAKSRNGLGYILAKQHKIDAAKEQFNKAIELDPTRPSAYLNLAEISASEGDYDTAINLDVKALDLDPNRSFTYIRLGQLYIDGFKDYESAHNVWKRGLRYITDPPARKKLEQLLNTN